MNDRDRLVMINGICQKALEGSIAFSQALMAIIPVTDEAVQAKRVADEAGRKAIKLRNKPEVADWYGRPEDEPYYCIACSGRGWVEDVGSCAADGMQTKRCARCKGSGISPNSKPQVGYVTEAQGPAEQAAAIEED